MADFSTSRSGNWSNGVTWSGGFVITNVNTTTKTFTVSGDHAAALGTAVDVAESTANDGHYTVVSAIYSAPNTNVIVTEAIPSTTIDGRIAKHIIPDLDAQTIDILEGNTVNMDYDSTGITYGVIDCAGTLSMSLTAGPFLSVSATDLFLSGAGIFVNFNNGNNNAAGFSVNSGATGLGLTNCQFETASIVSSGTITFTADADTVIETLSMEGTGLDWTGGEIQLVTESDAITELTLIDVISSTISLTSTDAFTANDCTISTLSLTNKPAGLYQMDSCTITTATVSNVSDIPPYFNNCSIVTLNAGCATTVTVSSVISLEIDEFVTVLNPGEVSTVAEELSLANNSALNGNWILLKGVVLVQGATTTVGSDGIIDIRQPLTWSADTTFAGTIRLNASQDFSGGPVNPSGATFQIMSSSVRLIDFGGADIQYTGPSGLNYIIGIGI